MSSGIIRNRFDPFAGDPKNMFSLGTVSVRKKEPIRHPAVFERSYAQQYEVLQDFGLDVNKGVLALYGTDNWLSMDDIVARILAETVEKLWKSRRVMYRWTIESEDPWLDAGRIVAGWVGLGIAVEEPGPSGEHGWRLVSRELIYAEEGKGRERHVVRIRGLPPEEQAARYALEARRAKAALTYDAKARDRRQPEIDAKVREILSHDPDFLIPDYWARSEFVDEAMVGKRLDESADVARGAHHLAGLDRERLDEWIRCLGQSECDARHTPRPTTIELPGDDDAALESLVL